MTFQNPFNLFPICSCKVKTTKGSFGFVEVSQANPPSPEPRRLHWRPIAPNGQSLRLKLSAYWSGRNKRTWTESQVICTSAWFCLLKGASVCCVQSQIVFYMKGSPEQKKQTQVQFISWSWPFSKARPKVGPKSQKTKSRKPTTNKTSKNLRRRTNNPKIT